MAELKSVREQMKRDNKKWPMRLTEVPREQWPDGATRDQFRVLRSRWFLVQVFVEGKGIIRLSVCRASIKKNGAWDDRISWEELQSIKEQAGYGGRDAVEIYPRDSDVVNVSNMRHLWIMPFLLTFAWRGKTE